MNDLIDTTEMYLKAIVELEEQRIVPLRARIAERLDHSGPTVSQTIARMERDGLVTVHTDRRLELTDEGRALATSVMRKHRLAERLLSDVIGLDWELVHDEACRWEHVMSEQVERRLIAMLPEHRRGPYGNPVPGLEELGVEQDPEESVISLAALAEAGDSGECEIAWIAEPLQVDHYLLGQLKATGIVPGATVTVRAGEDYITVAAVGSETVLDLPPETAANVFAAR